MRETSIEKRKCRLKDGFSFEMVHISKGTFMMGSDDGIDREKPIHPVTVPAFWLAPVPVTQALWEAVMGPEANRSAFAGASRPVDTVNWRDIEIFLKELNDNKIDKGCNLKFRLPTEAEWEYAARGGPRSLDIQTNHTIQEPPLQGLLKKFFGKKKSPDFRSRDFVYAGSNDLHEVGWYRDNSHRETKPVGLKRPNALGLYDMSGNVWEWVEDDWHKNYEGAPADGTAWSDNGKDAPKVLRGGSWINDPIGCRSTNRSDFEPVLRINDIGFRLAASPLV